MIDYLFETNMLSALLDPSDQDHTRVDAYARSLPNAAKKYVSAVSLAEIEYGLELHHQVRGAELSNAANIVAAARSHDILPITHHTAREYAQLKTRIAVTWMKDALSKKRRRWVENWEDVTGQRLQIDENDLWICAQARERNLMLVTSDAKLRQRVSAADTEIQIHLV